MRELYPFCACSYKTGHFGIICKMRRMAVVLAVWQNGTSANKQEG
ncbi:hypothetical protein COLINT_02282 [Collinsella intestinalis DSM 13280]|uniref:Uncharacterized protein n=1 Tax=Collinsella intestinalis DSM 13280 TaxID=521003 RepID=C4F8B2_9ACTN|nr:hypothetical protein COLINT_02282 [Collinsella intestinalis DSM 13280]